MIPNKIFKEWIEKADEDFGFASINLNNPSNPYYAQICYHFQQAAEKYLKAYIVAYSLEFKKIHDLPELLRICMKKESSFSSISQECEFLTDYYIDTRYPVHWPTKVDRKEVKEAKVSAEKIGSFVKSLLESL